MASAESYKRLCDTLCHFNLIKQYATKLYDHLPKSERVITVLLGMTQSVLCFMVSVN